MTLAKERRETIWKMQPDQLLHLKKKRGKNWIKFPLFWIFRPAQAFFFDSIKALWGWRSFNGSPMAKVCACLGVYLNYPESFQNLKMFINFHTFPECRRGTTTFHRLGLSWIRIHSYSLKYALIAWWISTWFYTVSPVPSLLLLLLLLRHCFR